MTLKIITPTLGKKNHKVRDLVISTLRYKYPLTLMKLTNSINKKYGSGVTFQGVRRAVNSLVEEEVLLKKNKEYLINQEWILKMKDFFDNLNDSYSSKGEILNIEELGEDIKIYTMKNMIEADKLWNKIIARWFEEDKATKSENLYVQLAGHTWYVFGQMSEETEIVNFAKKYKIKPFILCNADTILDRWCKKYYEDIGCNFKTNKTNSKKDNKKYFGVYKNYIIQLEAPEVISKEIDNIYNNAKSFQTFDALRLTKILLRNIPIKLMVMRNNVLAENLRESVLKHF